MYQHIWLSSANDTHLVSDYISFLELYDDNFQLSPMLAFLDYLFLSVHTSGPNPVNMRSLIF